MKNSPDDAIPSILNPEDVLLGAFSYFTREELTLEELITIGITSVKQSGSVLSEDLLVRMRYNVQGVLQSMVKRRLLTWRKDKNDIVWFKRIEGNLP